MILSEEPGDDRDDAVESLRDRRRAALRLRHVDLAEFVGDHRPVWVAGFKEDGIDVADGQRRFQHPNAGSFSH